MNLDPFAYIKQSRIVYGFFIEDKLLYIGSSSLPLHKVEHNHRNAFNIWPLQKQTRFRHMLRELDSNLGEFKRLLEYKCARPVIEAFEGQLIRAFNPLYNDDKDPVNSSKVYGRY